MNVVVPERVAAVVLAGGAGTRFGAGVSKVYVALGGRPILAYPLEVMADSDAIDDVVVVIRAGDRRAYDAAAADVPTAKVRAVVPGGDTRQASEWAGIEAVRDHCRDATRVLLQDAARPFPTLQLIVDLVATSHRHAAGVVPARRLDEGVVSASGAPIGPADLVGVQTPQAFPLSVLLSVYPRAIAEGFEGVDTAQTVQAYSDLPIRWIPGGARNPKVTHPDDLDAAEALLPSWRRGTWA